MPLLETPEYRLVERPDRLLMPIPGLEIGDARRMANQAVREARRKMPKATGYGASRISPAYGQGYFGVKWQDSYVWFQENGINPFTMTSLAGKTIPMWIDDPTGEERAKNPKARTRVTQSGKSQVLIFRRVAQIGQRKTVRKVNRRTGEVTTNDVPMSYPGAPGRIGIREAGGGMTAPGRVAGAIARGNVGVRWRHPGLAPRMFMNNALTLTAQWNGFLPVRVYATDSTYRTALRQAGRGLEGVTTAPQREGL